MLKLTKIRGGPSGGPWTRSTGMGHGVRSMFCIRPHCLVYFGTFSFVYILPMCVLLNQQVNHACLLCFAATERSGNKKKNCLSVRISRYPQFHCTTNMCDVGCVLFRDI